MYASLATAIRTIDADAVFMYTDAQPTTDPNTPYIGHNYTGHNYIGHNYLGHNYLGNYLSPFCFFWYSPNEVINKPICTSPMVDLDS